MKTQRIVDPAYYALFLEKTLKVISLRNPYDILMINMMIALEFCWRLNCFQKPFFRKKSIISSGDGTAFFVPFLKVTEFYTQDSSLERIKSAV